MRDDQRLRVAQRFGDNLREVRRREDLSQEQLARRASLHRTEIGMLERGHRLPRVDTLVRLADSMGVPTTDLLVGIYWVPGPDVSGTFVLGNPPTWGRATGDGGKGDRP